VQQSFKLQFKKPLKLLPDLIDGHFHQSYASKSLICKTDLLKSHISRHLSHEMAILSFLSQLIHSILQQQDYVLSIMSLVALGLLKNHTKKYLKPRCTSKNSHCKLKLPWHLLMFLTWTNTHLCQVIMPKMILHIPTWMFTPLKNLRNSSSSASRGKLVTLTNNESPKSSILSRLLDLYRTCFG